MSSGMGSTLIGNASMPLHEIYKKIIKEKKKKKKKKRIGYETRN